MGRTCRGENQRSEVRGQRSEVRSQRSEGRDLEPQMNADKRGWIDQIGNCFTMSCLSICVHLRSSAVALICSPSPLRPLRLCGEFLCGEFLQRACADYGHAPQCMITA